MKRIAPVMIVTLVAVITGLWSTGNPTASAHERRAIGDKYMMVVGFLGEPAFVDEPNGLDLRIFTGPAGANLQELPADERVGIEGLEETLEAEVTFGEQTMKLEIEPRFRDPGAYDGNFFPTAVGDYTFHIFGMVEDTPIDETFTSSPETFSPINDVAELQFPAKVPSNLDLDERLSAVEGDAGGSDSPSATADDDDDDSSTALIVAIVGVVAGVAGLAAGGFALARGRS
jgi:hypothetical protein